MVQSSELNPFLKKIRLRRRTNFHACMPVDIRYYLNVSVNAISSEHSHVKTV